MCSRERRNAKCLLVVSSLSLLAGNALCQRVHCSSYSITTCNKLDITFSICKKKKCTSERRKHLAQSRRTEAFVLRMEKLCSVCPLLSALWAPYLKSTHISKMNISSPCKQKLVFHVRLWTQLWVLLCTNNCRLPVHQTHIHRVTWPCSVILLRRNALQKMGYKKSTY